VAPPKPPPADSRASGKSIRFPEGSDLLPWFEQHAQQAGVSVNATLLRALEAYRAAIEGDPPRAVIEGGHQEGMIP